MVEKLQARLQELGYYTGAVDGDFGENTEKAFKQFQKNAGLYVDGIAGNDTEYLYADDAPAYVSETEKTDSAESAEEDKLEIAAREDEQELADTLLDTALKAHGGVAKDDMTAVAVRLFKSKA